MVAAQYTQNGSKLKENAYFLRGSVSKDLFQ